MKKITPRKISKRLAQYGALTVAIAAISDASGQIVYTDVDPDFGGPNVNFLLDLDNDGFVDYDLVHGDNGANAVRIHNTSSNAILGFNAGGNYNYPFALDSGAAISSGATDWLIHSVYQTLNWNSCSYTNSMWCGVTDKYLGLQFHINGVLHYGWARLDVPLDPSGWLIKDYAYNTVPGEAIMAGQLLAVEDFNTGNFDYFVDVNNQLVLSSATPMNGVEIFNLQGQALITQELNSTNEVIDLASFASGVYLATITIDETRKTVKIVKK